MGARDRGIGAICCGLRMELGDTVTVSVEGAEMAHRCALLHLTLGRCSRGRWSPVLCSG